ncbi:hypothetical protein CBR_g19477 [Chara braunii]|uniref:Glycosyltransferase 2-like domain-containing protein n=1 Tax=Chara braunii TaxID=69332 RepID=A0A388KY21_CHABU|nr:hypothetical protein CBR_g19477 [Chara braunii]|eukprot:GBG74964.1 hypothetical protein CBR_g19477 [Chara braunii]
MTRTSPVAQEGPTWQHLLVVVVIATRNRLRLLRDHALLSIAKQIQCPTAVVVVNDSNLDSVEQVAAAVADVFPGAYSMAPYERRRVAGTLPNPFPVMVTFAVIANSRTPGASGAWNTGISWAANFAHVCHQPWEATFVAFLDDDDEWEPHHLASCVAAVQQTGAQQVVPGVIRVATSGCGGDGGSEIHRQSIPAVDALCTRSSFYIRNPHIQASNLFASVALLARAGLFCEALSSTTDRDLMARISALPFQYVGFMPLTGPEPWTVRHYAEAERTDRLSTYGCPAKAEGLRTFFSIHGPSMTENERAAFLQHSREMFGVDPLASSAAGGSSSRTVASMTRTAQEGTTVLGQAAEECIVASAARMAPEGTTELGQAAEECIVAQEGTTVLGQAVEECIVVGTTRMTQEGTTVLGQAAQECVAATPQGRSDEKLPSSATGGTASSSTLLSRERTPGRAASAQSGSRTAAPNPEARTVSGSKWTGADACQATTPLPIIVGVVSDKNDGETIRQLIRDMARIQREGTNPIVQLFVLVLENGWTAEHQLRNGRCDSPPSALADAVYQEAAAGAIAATVITPGMIASDVRDGLLPPLDEVMMTSVALGDNHPGPFRLSIATMRTLLQYYAYMVASDIKLCFGLPHLPRQDSGGPSESGLGTGAFSVSPALLTGPVVWILDDDKDLSPLVIDVEGNNYSSSRDMSHVTGKLSRHWAGKDFVPRALRIHHATGAAAVIAVDTGAPPVPSLSCLRVQLVDVLALLQAAAACGSGECLLPQCSDVRTAMCLTPSFAASCADQGQQDWYHDLSNARSDHLEVPCCPMCMLRTACWGMFNGNREDGSGESAGTASESSNVTTLQASLVPVRPGSTATDALKLAAQVLTAIGSGAMVTRPLAVPPPPHDSGTPCGVDRTHPSVLRGGCTLVFDLDALRDVPNVAPVGLSGRTTRRSDMMWCLLNRELHGRHIVQAPLLAVYHRRGNIVNNPKEESGTLLSSALDVLADDILGHATFMALRGAFETAPHSTSQTLSESSVGCDSHDPENGGHGLGGSGSTTLHGIDELCCSGSPSPAALLTPAQEDEFVKSFHFHLSRRSLAAQLSAARIVGLLQSMRELLKPAESVVASQESQRRNEEAISTSGRAWWESLPEAKLVLEKVEMLAAKLQLDVLWPQHAGGGLGDRGATATAAALPLMLDPPADEELRAWVRSLPGRNMPPLFHPGEDVCRSVCDRLRSTAARPLLAYSLRELGDHDVAATATLVGVGSEGVTFCIPPQPPVLVVDDRCRSDEQDRDSPHLVGNADKERRVACKVMDMFALRAQRGDWSWLMEVAAEWSRTLACTKGLPGASHLTPAIWPLLKLKGFIPVGSHVPILAREYLQGATYSGGLGPQLIALLRSMRLANVCCKNISPENLLVVEDNYGQGKAGASDLEESICKDDQSRRLDDHTPRLSPSLVLLDYGLDIVPYTPAQFRICSLRAFLCWRWSGVKPTPSVKALLSATRGLLEPNGLFCEANLPEAAGFWQFERALEDDAGELERRMSLRVNECVMCGWPGLRPPPRSILDFGCGPCCMLLTRGTNHGGMVSVPTDRIRAFPLQIVGYDPEISLRERWEKSAAEKAVGSAKYDVKPEFVFVSDRQAVLDLAAKNGGFQSILCSRVLCTLPAGSPSEESLLEDLRKCLAPHGVLYLAMCHPDANSTAYTNMQARCVEERLSGVGSVEGGPSMLLHKRHGCSKSARSRKDYHRPLHVLLRTLRSHGFGVIAQRTAVTGVDLQRFETVPEVLLLACTHVEHYSPSSNLPSGPAVVEPGPRPQQPVVHHNAPTAALLIKLCAMEWQTLVGRVRHLVSSLEGPHAFAGGIHVVLDRRSSDFPRPHGMACSWETLLALADDLKCKGWIESVLVPPEDEVSVSALLGRWFGSASVQWSTSTHASNGSPLVSTLYAFEELCYRHQVQVVLQVDSDLMIRRGGRSRSSLAGSVLPAYLAADGKGYQPPDYLQPAIALLTSDDGALTLALPIVPRHDHSEFIPYSCGTTIGGVLEGRVHWDGDESCAYASPPAHARPWRVEVRGCFMHLPRLMSLRPLPTEMESAGPAATHIPPVKALPEVQVVGPPPWYRSVDLAIERSAGGLRSYRGGDAAAMCFVHPPNDLKQDPGIYGQIIDVVERSAVLPSSIAGCVDAPVATCSSDLTQWLSPPPGATSEVRPEASSWWRVEDYVFIVAGWRVPAGRVARCLESLCIQKVPEGVTWGAVVVWDHDHSPHDNNIANDDDDDGTGVAAKHDMQRSRLSSRVCCWQDTLAYVSHMVEGGGMPRLRGRCTLLMPRVRRGILANTITAIRQLCRRPTSVIILLDLDDALIGDDVLEVVHNAFARAGVDVFAGGGMRTDKPGRSSKIGEPTYHVNFTDLPRGPASRGGCVWSHLRAARKVLFDRVKEGDLKASDGEYWHWASDWALMLPLVDMAWRAAQPLRALYFHEPATPASAETVRARECAIAALVSQPSYAKLVPVVAVVGDASYGRRQEVTPADVIRGILPDRASTAKTLGTVLAMRGYRVLSGGMGGAMEAVSLGTSLAVTQTGMRDVEDLRDPSDDLAGASPQTQTRMGLSDAEILSTSGSTCPISVQRCGTNALVSCAPFPASAAACIGLLPGRSPFTSNPWVGMPLPTDMGHGRNNLVATAADAIVIIGGGAGSLHEAAVAWEQHRLVIAMVGTGGTADLLANRRIDERRRLHGLAARMEQQASQQGDKWGVDRVYGVHTVDEVVDVLERRLHWYRLDFLEREVGDGGRSAITAGVF